MSEFTPYVGYISKQNDGWLRVKLSNNTEISIPQYTKVKVTEPLNRDEFVVLEGSYKNKRASIKQKNGGGSYIKTGYYIDTGSGTSINVKLRDGDKIVTIPQYVSIKPGTSSDQGRDSFIILQGTYKNKSASVKKKSGGGSYIRRGNYIDTGDSGSIRIKLIGGQIVTIPQFTNVKLERSLSRDDFEILEGFYKGKHASVKSKSGGGSYITKTSPSYKSGASLIFNRKEEKLKVPGIGEFNAFSKWTPISLGTHDIEFPDAPHTSNSAYASAKLYRVWFRLGHSGDRYLHCGLRTAGCITVLDIDHWDKMCDYLLLCRKDSRNVGTVRVVDSWN